MSYIVYENDLSPRLPLPQQTGNSFKYPCYSEDSMFLDEDLLDGDFEGLEKEGSTDHELCYQSDESDSCGERMCETASTSILGSLDRPETQNPHDCETSDGNDNDDCLKTLTL